MASEVVKPPKLTGLCLYSNVASDGWLWLTITLWSGERITAAGTSAECFLQVATLSVCLFYTTWVFWVSTLPVSHVIFNYYKMLITSMIGLTQVVKAVLLTCVIGFPLITLVKGISHHNPDTQGLCFVQQYWCCASCTGYYPQRTSIPTCCTCCWSNHLSLILGILNQL